MPYMPLGGQHTTMLEGIVRGRKSSQEAAAFSQIIGHDAPSPFYAFQPPEDLIRSPEDLESTKAWYRFFLEKEGGDDNVHYSHYDTFNEWEEDLKPEPKMQRRFYTQSGEKGSGINWTRFHSIDYTKLQDLEELAKVVAYLKPSKEVDLRPILVICQGLLKDILVRRSPKPQARGGGTGPIPLVVPELLGEQAHVGHRDPGAARERVDVLPADADHLHDPRSPAGRHGRGDVADVVAGRDGLVVAEDVETLCSPAKTRASDL